MNDKSGSAVMPPVTADRTETMSIATLIAMVANMPEKPVIILGADGKILSPTREELEKQCNRGTAHAT